MSRTTKVFKRHLGLSPMPPLTFSKNAFISEEFLFLPSVDIAGHVHDKMFGQTCSRMGRIMVCLHGHLIRDLSPKHLISTFHSRKTALGDIFAVKLLLYTYYRQNIFFIFKLNTLEH